ncbi:conjugative transposon protein TraN [Dyadobacter jiangsuensis]
MSNSIFQGLTRLLLLAWILLPSLSTAQNGELFANETLPIEISAERTVSIAFPSTIKSVDRGSSDLLVEKARGTENVLLVKWARKGAQPTSLIVVTGDGAVHSFETIYQDSPGSISLRMVRPSGQLMPNFIAQIDATLDERMVEETMHLAEMAQPNLDKRDSNGDFLLDLQGLFVQGPVMLIKLSLSNQSPIDYDIESLRLFISDKKQVKRTASQREEIVLIRSAPSISKVSASEEKTLIIAFPKLTLPNSKRLHVELTEKGGARHVQIQLKSRHLYKVQSL